MRLAAGRSGAAAVSSLALVLSGCMGEEAQEPEPPELENVPAGALAGAHLFYGAGCLQCHTYEGQGSSNLGAPDLTYAGDRKRGVDWQIRHLKNPAAVVPGSAMPSYASLGERDLRDLAVFLESRKSR